MLPDGVAVRDKARDEAKGNRAERELHISHPHRDIGALENLLKVDAGEARAEAGAHGSYQAEHSILFEVRRLGLLDLRQLHQHHAEDQHQQRRPLDRAERAPQNQHGEEGSC